jgi:regulator of sirC expression with transglutaminase-like and TPR domain
MHELSGLLARRDENVRLDIAALQLARIEHPDLPLEPFTELLDSHAKELAERVDGGVEGDEFIDLMNEYLFEELGFRGNQEDYYNPSNSCLNDVLTHRLGIPISLSVLYMEIARRLERPVYGIGLPGHFIVQYNDGEYSAFIDPYHGGRLLTEPECYGLAREVTGLEVADDPSLLMPVTKRHIAIRMLNNLRAVYFRKQEHAKAVEVLTLLIEADPSSADEYKQRGICRTHVKSYKGARVDLEMYLKLAPNAADKKEVEEQIARLKKYIAAMN